ncbi:MAG: tRNA threonylcarbamoyladenosine dehydratase [Succiniclasticum sp.]|jgi:tRNA A37 threonylcarbamoyladenosine dehydratase
MLHEFSRTELLFGSENMQKLKNARVILFGVGGVGGYAAEALARSGVGHLTLVDHDTVSLTNLNRQIIALHSTLGRPKVEVMAERIHDIAPDCDVRTMQCFYLPETQDQFDLTQYDYVIDAVDTVAAKIQLVVAARKAGVPVISSMGAGNKIDPGALQIADLSKTRVCPLAKVMRKELRKRRIEHLKVVYSTETPLVPRTSTEQKGTSHRPVPGSTAFVPSVAGLLLAGEVVRDLTGVRPHYSA